MKNSVQGATDVLLELDVRLREQPAVEQLRVARRVLLHQRHHDTKTAASELIPVRAAESETASRVAVVVRVGIEEVETTDAGPARGTLPAFAEERQAAALDVDGDERVVGRGEILRGDGDVRLLVT